MKEFIDKMLGKPVAVGIIIGAISTGIVKIINAANKSK